MHTDQALKFHKGQEFTKKDGSGVHCIIQSYVEGELAYLVTYTCSGHSNNVSEADLERLYAPAKQHEKLAALDHLHEKSESHEDDRHENGTPLSPGSHRVKG
jgi:hypothetical protein